MVGLRSGQVQTKERGIFTLLSYFYSNHRPHTQTTPALLLMMKQRPWASLENLLCR